ncbi:hypothetical protein RhiirC2_781258 [Rhizophagus irregularis]|uniref:Uncharacterized protein n=1 Tax=Rhizophagus irregularis TaxID=588596 RepID=A0A2N1N5N5_9GLOM|nr:hypothetical protein RhiirC2_781258 [Rhizophagus irregularis]
MPPSRKGKEKEAEKTKKRKNEDILAALISNTENDDAENDETLEEIDVITNFAETWSLQSILIRYCNDIIMISL